MFSPFEGTQVLKRDRATHKSITLIEADKNTNCALLNCWHWTGWIRPSILTTGDGPEGRPERPERGGWGSRPLEDDWDWSADRETKLCILFPKVNKKRHSNCFFSNLSAVLYSCWLLQSHIYTHTRACIYSLYIRVYVYILLSWIQSKKNLKQFHWPHRNKS